MNKAGYLMFVLFIGIVTVGMGSFGDQHAVKVPEPDTNYEATLIDQSDQSMKLEKLSCKGQTFIFGSKGRSQLSVDFKKIRSIFFFLKGDKVEADITLKDGNTMKILVDKDIPWHGASAYANVRIDTKDIKTILLHDGD